MRVVLAFGLVALCLVAVLGARAFRARRAGERSAVRPVVAPVVAPLPAVVEEVQNGGRGWEVFSRLLEQRIVVLGTAIDDEVANVAIAQLLFLESEDPKAPIYLYINSPGGYVTASLAIRDVMRDITPDVCTIVMKQASGTALMLAAAGARGQRYALPDARFTLTSITQTRADTDAADLARTASTVAGFLATDTGQTVTTIAKDSELQRTLTAGEAVAYGLVDEVYVRGN